MENIRILKIWQKQLIFIPGVAWRFVRLSFLSAVHFLVAPLLLHFHNKVLLNSERICNSIALLITFQIFYTSVECSSPAGKFSHSEPVDWPHSLVSLCRRPKSQSQGIANMERKLWSDTDTPKGVQPPCQMCVCVCQWVNHSFITVAACRCMHCSPVCYSWPIFGWWATSSEI